MHAEENETLLLTTYKQKLKDKIYEKDLTKTFKVKFLTYNVFVFYKNLLCRLPCMLNEYTYVNHVSFKVSSFTLLYNTALIVQ